MGTQLIFALLGVAGKVGGYLISNWLEERNSREQNRHELEMALANRPPPAHDSGFDDAHSSTRLTRRLLALMLIFAVCSVQLYCVLNAAQTFAIPTAKDPGFFGWLFGGVAESSLQVSLGWVALRILDIQTMCASFYFTPVGKK